LERYRSRMGPRPLFVAEVLLYAAFPLYFATLRSAMRIVFLYVYIGVVLVIGGFLGSVHSFPLSDDVRVSAGSVAYGGLMMSTVVLVIVGRDLEVVRNAIRIVVASV